MSVTDRGSAEQVLYRSNQARNGTSEGMGIAVALPAGGVRGAGVLARGVREALKANSVPAPR